MKKIERQGSLFVVCGPSGAGKSTVLNGAMPNIENITFSVSATTRTPREGEIDGANYFFISKEEFEKQISEGQFIEYDFHFGNYYGTPKSFVSKNCAEGIDIILDIDVKGALTLRENGLDASYIFILPPSMDILKERLSSRGTETTETLEDRIARASWEISQIDKFDYFIINDDLNLAVLNFESIIRTERLRISRSIEHISQLFH